LEFFGIFLSTQTPQVIRQTLRLSIQQQVQNTLRDKLFSGPQLLFYSSIWINPASHIAVWTDSSSEFLSKAQLTILSLKAKSLKGKSKKQTSQESYTQRKLPLRVV
jgi:hypothetical protein